MLSQKGLEIGVFINFLPLVKNTDFLMLTFKAILNQIQK